MKELEKLRAENERLKAEGGFTEAAESTQMALEIKQLKAENAALRAKITRDTEAQAKTLDACYQKVKELEKKINSDKWNLLNNEATVMRLPDRASEPNLQEFVREGNYYATSKSITDWIKTSKSLSKKVEELEKELEEARENKAYFDSLEECCNKILDALDSHTMPKKAIAGLRILLNRPNKSTNT